CTRRLRVFPSFSCNVISPSVCYTLSLHDALPIFVARTPTSFETTRFVSDFISCRAERKIPKPLILLARLCQTLLFMHSCFFVQRSEEHTSELQSPYDLVCRLLLEKKKQHASTC